MYALNSFSLFTFRGGAERRPGDGWRRERSCLPDILLSRCMDCLPCFIIADTFARLRVVTGTFSSHFFFHVLLFPSLFNVQFLQFSFFYFFMCMTLLHLSMFQSSGWHRHIMTLFIFFFSLSQNMFLSNVYLEETKIRA